MNLLRGFLMLALILLPASMARAQDWVIYGIEICNTGTMGFDVASAEKKPGEWAWSDYSWQIRGWMPIAPKKCEVVWQDQNWESGWTVTKPIVHLVFAFTDSTGVWGVVPELDLGGTTSMRKSDLQFCVREDAFAYERPKGDPSSGCKSGYDLMPAAIEFNPAPSVVQGRWATGPDVNLALTAKDRAIPWQGSSTSAPTAAPRPDAPTAGSSLDKFLAFAEAARVQTLRKNVRAYIAAADTGFESYKKGAAQVIAGDRVWSAKEISLPADSCIVTESATNVNFRCLQYTSPSREEIEARYADLVKNVAAALPEDWKPYSGPDIFKNVLASKVFWSSSGLNWYIWIGYYDSSRSKYELFYEVLAPRRPGEGTRNAAPSKPAPAPAPNRSMTPEDDPIGEGGFITPYNVPKK